MIFTYVSLFCSISQRASSGLIDTMKAETPTLGAFLALLLKSSTRHEQTIKNRIQN